MIKKLGKIILGLTAFSAVIAGIIYFTKTRLQDEADDIFSEDSDDDGFDLEDDLSPVSDREYVSLNPSGSDNASASAAADGSTPDAESDTQSGETTANL